MIDKEIPKEYRRQHASGGLKGASSAVKNSAGQGFYCWPAFGGCVYYIDVPSSTYKNQKPTIKMYVNGSLHQTITPTATALSGKYLYEALFTGLSYGDTYYVTSTYGSDTYRINERTYKGGRGSAPTLTETSTQINASMSSPYNKTYSMPLGVVSFNSDYGTLNSYSREARTRLVESCLQYTEQDAVLGKVSNETSIWLDQYDPDTGDWNEVSVFSREAQIYRFELSTYSPAKVGIASSSSVTYYSYFSNYVDAWIEDVNELLGDTYFVRDDSIGETDKGIRITIGSHEDLFDYNPDDATGEVYIYYGTWERTRWYPSTGGTHHCEVKLCNELRVAMEAVSDFRNITYEELTECLGCGNDTFRVYDSMFSEIWYIGKSNNLLSGSSPTYDGEVVQMLYNELEMGETMSELVHKLTPSQACVVKLPCIKWGNVRNKSYSLSTYAMNRKVTWHTDPNEDTGTIYWWWDDDDNSFSDMESSVLSITPAYSTPPKTPTVYSRGSDYLRIDVGDTNTYDVKAVDSSGNEYVTSSTSGRYIYIRGLSPTTSYEIYSRITGSTAWFGGFTGTTAPASPQLTVSQSGTTLSVKVNPPTEGKYSYLYFRVYYYLNGEYTSVSVNPATVGTTYTYTADSATKYYVYAYTVYTVNDTDLISDSAYESGTIGKEKASNPTAQRINGGLIINWNTVSGATNYRIKLVNTETSTSATKTDTSPTCTWAGLLYGVTYNLSIDTYNGGWLGYCVEEPITTAPAQPVITSVTQKDGVITVSWELAADSNITSVYINLYTSGSTLLQEKTFKNVTSGTFSYSAVADGYYQIRAASSLLVGTTEIFSVDSSGNEYKLYKNVQVSARPNYFYWSDYTAYMYDGGIITYTPYEAWNALIANIEEMITFTGINGTMPSSSTLYGSASGKTYAAACAYAYMDSSDKTVYAQKFNIANYIISNIGASTGVGTKYSENSNYKVYASDFISLQDTINNIN